MKYRHLGRKSSHRQALLRNLVTSLFEHESISTTWPKAKEAQRLAEKLITLGKKNTEASKRKAFSIFYVRFTRSHHHFWIIRVLTEVLDTSSISPQALWHLPRTLRGETWRLHTRPTHRATQTRYGAISYSRTC
jgi:ribosomal protein L17